MHEPPADFTAAELAAALAAHWRLRVASADYLPVGFGGFHWRVTDEAARPWFVTASQLAGDDAFADLAATMATATALAEQGLSFVVAPVRAAAGEPVVRVRPDYAIALYPFAGGEPGRWGDSLRPADRAAVTGMLARLHASPVEPGLAPVRRPELAGAELLRQSLRERGRCWPGPYGRPAADLVADHAAGLAAALAGFDDLAALVAASGCAAVLTHGEPHSGNLIRRDDGYLLVDWDTAGLAPPERDLWWLVTASGQEAASYTDLTGRLVSQQALQMYRLRWDLDDICQFLAEFRGPHECGRDTEVAFAGFAAAVRRVAVAD